MPRTSWLVLVPQELPIKLLCYPSIHAHQIKLSSFQFMMFDSEITDGTSADQYGPSSILSASVNNSSVSKGDLICQRNDRLKGPALRGTDGLHRWQWGGHAGDDKLAYQWVRELHIVTLRDRFDMILHSVVFLSLRLSAAVCG